MILRLETLFVILLLIVSLYIVLPFLKYILLSIIFYTVSFPIFKKINYVIKNEKISAMLSIILIISLLIIPSAFIIYSIYIELTSNFSLITNVIDELYLNEKYKDYVDIILPSIYDFLSDIVRSLPNQLVGSFIAAFLTYYLIIERYHILSFIKKMLYFIKIDDLIDRTRDIIYGSIIGNIAFWTIQALLSYIAFVLLNVPMPITLTMLVFILAFLPFLGPWTVWLPIIYWLAMNGKIFEAIFALIYGIFFITIFAEIVIKPNLVSKFTQLHSVTVLLGIFGGLYSLGFVGIFLGPLILSISLEYLKILIGNEK